jgi:uncharacterized NAD-dependent epimerase/dehydratase family protein
MARFVILSIDSFDYIENKTGNMLIRYRTSEVVAVIDPSKQGLCSQDVIGVGGKIPVVSSFNESKRYKPDTLVIGNAPQAGKITEEMKSELISALSFGVDVISGMHNFLSTDKELLNIAKKNKAKIIDLRKPPSTSHFPEGTWKNRSTPVLLVVGSDCDTGKMTTAWEIKERLSAYNKNIEFIGTGQTGILLSKGVAIDAVVADFMAGEVEYLIDKHIKSDTDLVVVEGQGSITNYAYSGVTLGLLHGCMPDYLVLTHDVSRTSDVMGQKIPDLETFMKMHIDLMAPFRETRFLGINLLTFEMSDEEAIEQVSHYKTKYELPTTDLIRFGDSDFIDAIKDAIE